MVNSTGWWAEETVSLKSQYLENKQQHDTQGAIFYVDVGWDNPQSKSWKLYTNNVRIWEFHKIGILASSDFCPVKVVVGNT